MPASLLLAVLVAAAPPAGPTVLTSKNQLNALCADLLSAPGPGSKHKAALATEWVAHLAAGQFSVEASDARDGTLILDAAAGFQLFNGQALLTSVDDDEMELSLAEGQAQPTHPEKLTLEVVFRPGQAIQPPCSQGLTAEVTVAIEVLGLKLLDKDGHTVAFLDSSVLTDRPTPAGGKPEVDIDPAQVEGSATLSDRLTEALQALKPQLLACFEHALTAAPTLDGVLALGFVLGHDGHPGPITLVADSVQDDGLSGCVTEKVKGVTVKSSAKGKKTAGESAGGRSSVTLRFERH